MDIIYLFDPLCGWCYGFGPHLQQFAIQHPEIQYTVLTGGMVTGPRVGPLSQIAPYIREGVHRVAQLSGVKFGSHFLQDLHGEGKLYMDSTPPSKAFIIFRKHQPNSALTLAHEIQAVFYADGQDLNRAESYEALCERYELDFAAFKADFEGMDYQLATLDEFDEVARYGVSGYPSTILKLNEQYFLLAQGFSPAAQLEKTFRSILSAQA